MLGGFGAHVDGRAVPAEAWRHRRGADLVKLLALAPGHRMHREQVVDALWPELDADAGGRNLRKALHFARRALGTDDAVRAEGVMLALWPSGSLEVDAEQFERSARDGVGRRDVGAAARAAELYAADLLPEDRYEPWAEGPRERLRRLFVDVLKIAGRWRRVIEADPLDEEAYRELMSEALEAGDRQGAMRWFERLRDVLSTELGVGPDPQSVALYERVLAMEGPQPATPEERARARLAAGLVAMNRMDLDEAEREATAARALAVEAGLGKELGQASGLLGMVAHMRGAWRELFREEFLQAISGPADLAAFVFDAHLCLGEFSLAGPEGPEEVGRFARELLHMAEERDSIPGAALATLMLGEAELMAGRLQEAERDLSRATELHARAEATAGRALALERLGEAALARGRRSRAARLLRDAMALARSSELSSHLVVRVHGARVRLSGPDSAPEEIGRAEKELAGLEVCEPCSMGFLVAAAIGSARAGRTEEAQRHLEHAERVAAMWQGGPWLAAVWEGRAQLRLAESEPGQAAALFREAADLFGRCGHSLSEAGCRAAALRAEEAPAGNVSGTPRG
jgi:DNA-binding SARP family transcriptional activator